MLKPLAIGLLLVSNSLFAADAWEACGETQDRAISNLAKSIISQTTSETKVSASSKGFFGVESAHREASSKMSTRSNLKLSDIQVEKKGQEYCATIDKASLLKFSKALRDQTKTYQQANLPEAVKPQIKQLDVWLNDLQQMKALMLVFPAEFGERDQQALAEQQKSLRDVRDQLHPQFVRFNVHGAQAQLQVDGQSYALGSEIYLAAGEHHYTIQSQDSCPVHASFVLERKKDQLIDVNLKDSLFPSFSFNANKPTTRLEIDGDQRQLGKRYSIRKCSGEVSVKLTYRDGTETQTQGDTYLLKPGLVISEDFTFYSQAELQALQAQAESFKSGKRLEVKYTYVSLPDETNLSGVDVQPMHQLRLNYLDTQDWLRHGPGVMLGHSKGQYSADLVYNFGLQLSGFGMAQKPIHLGSLLTMIPFVNLQVGFGYHQYAELDGNQVVRHFPKKASDEKEEWIRDYGVARLGAGVDFAFNDTMALQLFAEQAFTQEENLIFGIGLSLKLPEK